MRFITVFPLLAAIFSAPALGAMYKWTDKDGQVQYGQYPPAGVDAKPIKADTQPKTAPARQSLDAQLEALDQRKKEQAEQAAEAAEKAEDAKNREINCRNAKSNIEQLTQGGHRLARMPDGSYKRFTEEERQAQIAKNKKAVKEYCD